MVTAPEAGAERLDRLLAGAWADLSRSRLQALIKAGHVAVEGVPCTDPSWKPPPGIGIALHEPPPAAAAPQAESIPLVVLFEDSDLIVLDKPAGLVVHPGAGHAGGTRSPRPARSRSASPAPRTSRRTAS